MRISSIPTAAPASSDVSAPLSSGEIHFFYWFIQRCTGRAYTYQQTSKAWGFCPRHARGFLTVEAACQNGRLHGPVILYADLMVRAHHALQREGRMAKRRVAWSLRDRGPCLVCESGMGPQSPTLASADLVERSGNPREIRAFARSTHRYWQDTVCGCCQGTAAEARCRPHLLDDIRRGVALDLSRQCALVADISARADVYRRDFQWDARGSATEADRAALISAVGWCGGWSSLLGLVENS